MASWGRCVEAMEKRESKVLLELKAVREGCHKLAEWTAFAKSLAIYLSPAAKALLRVAPKAHPSI